MLIPILLFAAAGAAIGGGIGGGTMVLTRAQQERAKEELNRNRQDLREQLEAEIELQELRDRARKAGVDPDAVENGYLRYQSGQISLDDIRKQLGL